MKQVLITGIKQPSLIQHPQPRARLRNLDTYYIRLKYECEELLMTAQFVVGDPSYLNFENINFLSMENFLSLALSKKSLLLKFSICSVSRCFLKRCTSLKCTDGDTFDGVESENSTAVYLFRHQSPPLFNLLSRSLSFLFGFGSCKDVS